jgi:dephospho-CoA kinase
MIQVGLTGGIGSGKTTVAKMFENLGVPVFIADTQAKAILDQPEVTKEVAKTFNLELNSEGKINKPNLASIVFNNKKALERLNAIIHPKVQQSYKNWLKEQDTKYIIYEAAIIFEKDRASDFDYTILVTAPEDIRIKRVMKRDNVTYEHVKSRIKAQWPESKKKKLASFVVDNINLKETSQDISKINEYILSI